MFMNGKITYLPESKEDIFLETDYHKSLVACVAWVFRVMTPCCPVDGYPKDKRLITQRTAK
jgi:hypothetical protein